MHIEINNIRLDHSLELFELICANRTYLSEYLDWVGEMQTLENHQKSIAKMIADRKEAKQDCFTIKVDNAIVGMMSIVTITPQRLEIGYWLSEDQQGKGIVNMAYSLLEDKIKTEYPQKCLEIQCALSNLKSSKIALRNAYQLKQQSEDTLFFEKWI